MAAELKLPDAEISDNARGYIPSRSPTLDPLIGTYATGSAKKDANHAG